MTSEEAEPTVDGRTREELFADAVGLAPGYTPTWEPGDDAGTALVHLFAGLARHATERLDRAPAKYRVAFFDRLGFDREPPQASRLPLAFAVSDGAAENVRIPAGTRAATDDGVTFETEAGFEATPAVLTDVFSADPAADRLYSHGAAVAAGESFRPFAGRDRQAHVLTLGHAGLLGQSPGAPVRVRLRVDAASDAEASETAAFLRECLVWQWYGEATEPPRLDEPAPADEPVEDWHVVEPTAVTTETDRYGERVVSVELEPPGTLTTTEVGGRESRWLQATANRNCDPADVLALTVGPVTLSVGDRRAEDGDGTGTSLPGGAAGRTPEPLYANDVPLPPPSKETPILPFGDQPRVRDAFAFASPDALTASGASVTLTVNLANTPIETGDPTVSWEYWDGDAWARLPLDADSDPAAVRLTANGCVRFVVPDDLAATSVAGEEGHWIRIRLVGGDYGSVRYVRTEGAGAGAPGEPEEPGEGGEGGERTTETWTTDTGSVNPPKLSLFQLQYGLEEPPEHLLAADNGEAPRDVSVALRERARPFRGLPATGQTVALGFDRPLTDGPLQLLWSPTDRATPADFAPRLAWEYSAGRSGPRGAAGSSAAGNGATAGPAPEPLGEGSDEMPGGSTASTPSTPSTASGGRTEWAPLDATDGTEGLVTRGLVSVVVPDPSAEVPAFGASRHWLRATVLEDGFAVPEPPTGPADISVRVDRIDARRETVRLRNDGEVSLDLTGYLLDVEHGNPQVDQHRPLPVGTVVDAGGALTVATGRLSPGPADVWLDFRAPVLNDTVPDRVALLTPAGAEVTVGGVTGGGADDADGDDGAGGADGGDDCQANGGDGNEGSDCGCAALARDPDPCETTLPTAPSVGDPTEAPPDVEAVAINAGWASNVRRVTDEVLGGSDGTANQTLAVASPPVADGSIRVDEVRTLSAAERVALVSERPADVEVVGADASDKSADPTAVWVRWTEVDDFLASGPDDRHYTLDGLAGTVRFGDGRSGRVPPRGRDNVRASYDAGGGSAGNVPVGAVGSLESAIALVDAVTNPVGGDGGADAESTDAAAARAARTLRDGDRAVTAADFERLATTTTRRLARARCLPATDAAGTRRGGFVTLVIVPAGSTRKPVPSASLRERVEARVAAHAPTTVVASNRLFVRGPSYVEATVGTRVVAVPGVESVSAVERAVDDALSAFLHPLTGGDTGEGWPFGSLPCPADLFAVAEGVTDVDHVETLTVTFRGDDAEARVADGDEAPGVADDALVYAGTHDVRASRASAAVATGKSPDGGAGPTTADGDGTGGGG